MSEHFDVAIIGTQTAGLIAGALLAKRDSRVVLIDHGENARFYRHNGVHLPLVPTLVPNLDDSTPVKRVHEELGLGPELRAAIDAATPSFQAITPHHRIDVQSPPEAFIEELRHEFPALADPVRRFLDALFALDARINEKLESLGPLPPRSWMERLQFKRRASQYSELDSPFADNALLREIPDEHPVRDLLLGPLTFFGHLAPENPSTLHAVRLIARYFRGVMTFKDRLGGLHQLLRDKATDAGVDFRRGTLVRSLATDGRLVSHIETESGRPVSADLILYNALAPIEDLLPPGKASAKVSEESKSVRPAGSLLAHNLVVNRDVIPCGMGEAVFLLNGRQNRRDDEPRDPPIFLRRYPAQRSEANKARGQGPELDPQHEVLSIAIPVRTQEVTRSPERVAALRKQMLNRVRRLVPFLDEFVADESLPADTGGWDLETSDVVRAIDPWSLHPLYETDKRPWLGVAARPSTGYLKNVIFTGRDVLPGLGLEGEYMTALQAVEIVSKAKSKR